MKIFSIKLKFILLMLFVPNALMQAQTEFRIEGRVVETLNDMKSDLASATIALLNPDSTIVSGTTSDGKGLFRLKAQAGKDYVLRVTFMGYTPVNVAIKGLDRNLDLGDIELREDAKELAGVTVEGSGITRKIDRLLVYPSKDAVKHSDDPYDLISNMMVPRLTANRMNKTLESVSGSVQMRINGVKATQQEFLSIPAKDVIRIEVIDNPGLKYGTDAMVVDVIVKRRPTGGQGNGRLSFSPDRMDTESNASLKINHKKSQWSIYYMGFFKEFKKTWSDKEEFFNLGDRTVHRIQEGLYYRNCYTINNISLTYNLYTPDDYTLNIAFRNNLTNRPRNGGLNKMYNADTPEDYLYSRTDYGTRNYTPSLDVFFSKKFKHGQEFQMNVVGTIISTKSDRRYIEYEEGGKENQVDYITNIDGNKKSLWGELIYSKTFKSVIVSAGLRHDQSYTHNEYTGNNNPTISSMNLATSSAFMDISGRIKGINYLLSLGGTRSYFKEGSLRSTYYTFTPTFRVNLTPHKYGWMQYQFSISPVIPSLGSLTDVEQMIDTIQIQRGNPNLRTYKNYSNTIMYSYSRGHFTAFTMLNYEYQDKPIMEEFFVEEGKLIRTENNQRNAQVLSLYVDLSLRNVKFGNWEWNMQLYGGPTRMWSKGLTYNHTYNMILIGMNTNVYYKKFGLGFDYRRGGGNLRGETFYSAEPRCYIDLLYKYKKFSANAFMGFPFGGFETRGERFSKVAPMKQKFYIKDVEQQLGISLRYSFEFGNKFTDRDRQAKHGDSDAGVLSY